MAQKKAKSRSAKPKARRNFGAMEALTVASQSKALGLDRAFFGRKHPNPQAPQRVSVIQIWDDLHNQRPGYYRAFWCDSPDPSEKGSPVIGYASSGGSKPTIRAAAAEAHRLHPDASIYRNGRLIKGPRQNPAEDIDILNDMAPESSRGHIEFTPDGLERFVRGGYIYRAYSNTPVFEDGYRQGTVEGPAADYVSGLTDIADGIRDMEPLTQNVNPYQRSSAMWDLFTSNRGFMWRDNGIDCKVLTDRRDLSDINVIGAYWKRIGFAGPIWEVQLNDRYNYPKSRKFEVDSEDAARSAVEQYAADVWMTPGPVIRSNPCASRNPEYNAVQVMDMSKTEAEAQEVFEGLRLQDGFIGGRIIPPVAGATAPPYNSWRVQGFFRNANDTPEQYQALIDYPMEGTRPVFIPDSQHKALGIENPERSRTLPTPFMGMPSGMAIARGLNSKKEVEDFLKSSGKRKFYGKTNNIIVRQFQDGKWGAIARPKGLRANPESDSAALYEEFHGTPSESVLEIRETQHVHGHLAQLGILVSIVLKIKGGKKDGSTVELNAPPASSADEQLVHLCASEDGHQLYFVGGDQALDLAKLGYRDSFTVRHEGEAFDATDIKDHMVLGEIQKLTYQTQKNFDNFETVDYFHKVGEDTKVRPFLTYDTLNSTMGIAGGEYTIDAKGIVN